MPILTSAEPLKKKTPILMIIGDQGLSKTSLAYTFEQPLLIDFDEGAQRSEGRTNVLQFENRGYDGWVELLDLERGGELRKYKTIAIDTPKAALDDFLISYVETINPALATQKGQLKRYSAIGEGFKNFVNRCRENDAVIVFLCHAKKDEDGRVTADITGSSQALLMRIADQVGYITIRNGKRTILWDPTELLTLKNTARLPEMVLPLLTDPAWKTFGAELATKVKEKIWGMSEDQRAAVMQSQQYQELISNAETPQDLSGLADNITELPQYLNIPLMNTLGDKYNEYITNTNDVEAFNELLEEVNALPMYLREPLRKSMSAKVKKMGWIADETTKKLVIPPGTPLVQTNATTPSDVSLFTPATSTDKKEDPKKLKKNAA